MIEGLPASYDAIYIIKRKKKCSLCVNLFKIKEINEREVVYLDYYNFAHKSCLSDNNIEYKHLKKNNINSPIQPLIKKKL